MRKGDSVLGILLCDNQFELMKTIRKALEDVIERDRLNAEVVLCSTTPEKMHKFIKENPSLYFILLELLFFSGEKGSELAKRIREEDRESYIAFTSKDTHLLHTALEDLIMPAGFLPKPIRRKDLTDTFLRAYCDYKNRYIHEEYFGITCGARYYRVLCRSINYFEAFQKKVFLNTDTQRIGYYKSLDSISNVLSIKGFQRSHKGFVVNLSRISSVDYSTGTITMRNGAEIPLSRTYRDELNKRISEADAFHP